MPLTLFIIVGDDLIATITQLSVNMPREYRKLKVAAYARVSTNSEALLHSLSAQVSYYSFLIQNNPKWEYVGVYADEGITGTSQKHRNEFNRLLADCEEGKIVKEIYRRYFNGESAYKIAKDLVGQGITGQSGNPLEQTTVKEVLSNQSYTGTMVLQKNFLNESHKQKKNKGELPMYLVEDMFEPLESEEEYKKALNIRKKRAETFSNILIIEIALLFSLEK